jgi:hypothetical protein
MEISGESLVHQRSEGARKGRWGLGYGYDREGRFCRRGLPAFAQSALTLES